MNQPATEPASTRPACESCGGSMDGEHHKAKSHKACREGHKPKRTAIKIKAASFPEPDPEGETEEYFIGTLAGCPFQNVAVAGVNFPLFTGRASFDDKARILDGSVARGALALLTDAQADAVVESVRRKMIRPVGEEQTRFVPRLEPGDGPAVAVMRQRGQIVNIDGAAKPKPGDIPLAKFLYMIPTSGLDFKGRDREPEPMLEE